jgi:hypothetical protein
MDAMASTIGWLVNQSEYWTVMNKNYFQWKKGNQSMTVGVKIHISANSVSAEALAAVVLPYLQAQTVFHKMLSDTDLIAQADKDNQKRKFITAYPQSPDQLDDLCEGLNKLIIKSLIPCEPKALCYPINGDIGWGKSGYVFIRHGFFDKDDPSDDRENVSGTLRAYLLEDKTEGLFVARPSRY